MMKPSVAVIVAIGIMVHCAGVLAFEERVFVVGAVDAERRAVEPQNALRRNGERIRAINAEVGDPRDVVADVVVLPRVLAIEFEAVVEEVGGLAQEELLDGVQERVPAPLGAEHEQSVVLLTRILGRVQVEALVGDVEPPADVEQSGIDGDLTYVGDGEGPKS